MQLSEILKIEINALIQDFDNLITQENFNTYKIIRSKYRHLLVELQSKSKYNISDFEIIDNVYRLFGEAPPKNKELGIRIYDRMQKIYELQKKNVA